MGGLLGGLALCKTLAALFSLPLCTAHGVRTACYAHNTDVTLHASPLCRRRGGSDPRHFPAAPKHGLLCVQAAGARRPRDAHKYNKPDEATVEPEPGEGARTDTREDRVPAAGAALLKF